VRVAKPNKRKMANAICSFVAHPPPEKEQLNRNDKYKRLNNKYFYECLVSTIFLFSVSKNRVFLHRKFIEIILWKLL